MHDDEMWLHTVEFRDLDQRARLKRFIDVMRGWNTCYKKSSKDIVIKCDSQQIRKEDPTKL